MMCPVTAFNYFQNHANWPKWFYVHIISFELGAGMELLTSCPALTNRAAVFFALTESTVISAITDCCQVLLEIAC